MVTRFIGLASVLAAVAGASACSRDVQAVSPEQLQQRYGITGAQRVEDGSLRGTIVPVTLRDGTRAELIIPDGGAEDPHALYLRDNGGIHPVQLQDDISRDQLVQEPRIVSHRPERPHPRRRSWEKDAVIIGGGAGAGALVGALTGGKKGAAIGAGAGGVGGLIYDLAARHRR